MTRALLVLSLLVSRPLWAAEEPVDLSMFGAIREEGLERSKVMETLSHLTDVIGPRLTGSPAAKAANEWTRERLAAWGLANARLESFGPFGRGWSLERVSVTARSPFAGTLIAVPKAWTPATGGPVRGPVVKAKLDSLEDLEKWKGQLAGKIVLVGEPRALKPPETALFRRYSAKDLDDLALHGKDEDRQAARDARRKSMLFSKPLREFLVAERALAAIEPSERDANVVRVMGGGSREPGDDPGVPFLVMAAEHYNRLCRLLERKLPVELEIDVKARFHDDDAMAYNTLAEIPGSDPQGEVVMLGAHLDSWHSGTGASDNAAGSAVAMEAARILQALRVRPKRTIRIALWTGEEQGLLGSRAYVKQHYGSRAEPEDPEERKLSPSLRRSPPGPLTTKPDHPRLSAYFNLDNGTGRIRGIYTQGNLAAAPIFQAWLEPLRDLGVTTVTNRDTGGTDHVAFDSVGLPGFQFIQDEGDYETRTHHTNVDVYDRMHEEDLMQASVVMASFVYQAAVRPQRFPRKALPATP
jgi:hypothetical protein